jgi:hypothetical protein
MSWLHSITKALVDHKELLEALSYVAILLGIPAALWQYHRAVRKEALDREYGTYNALDEKYLHFQQLCLDHPELDIGDLPDETPHELDASQKKQELIGFTMLFAIFERAYLMYHDQSRELQKRQWEGWQAYIDDFCVRHNFRAAWEENGVTFDTRFMEFMKERLARAESTETKTGGTAGTGKAQRPARAS